MSLISVGDRVVCTRGSPDWIGVYIVTKLPRFSGDQFIQQSESRQILHQSLWCIKALRHEFEYAPTSSDEAPAPEVAPQAELQPIAAAVAAAQEAPIDGSSGDSSDGSSGDSSDEESGSPAPGSPAPGSPATEAVNPNRSTLEIGKTGRGQLLISKIFSLKL